MKIILAFMVEMFSAKLYPTENWLLLIIGAIGIILYKKYREVL